MSLEPSILFDPVQCEFYRGMAESGDSESSFKCVFKNGKYQGCVAMEAGAGQPLALFEEPSANVTRRHISWIVLCKEGTAWLWLPGSEKGEWVVRNGGQRILDIKSPSPQTYGMLRVFDSTLIHSLIGRTLVLFAIFLSIGPRRLLNG